MKNSLSLTLSKGEGTGRPHPDLHQGERNEEQFLE